METEGINIELIHLLKQHGIEAEIVDGKVVAKAHPHLFIDSQVIFQEHSNCITSQLNVLVEIHDQQIVECFGDVGQTKEQAKKNNLQNFCRNSFHPLIAGCFGYPVDDLDVETWEIGLEKYQVYIGNYGVKSNGGAVEGIPPALFTQVASYIKQLPLSQPYHWVRWYMLCTDGELDPIEFLVDNQPDEEGRIIIESAQWPAITGFYSVRNFILLKQTTDSRPSLEVFNTSKAAPLEEKQKPSLWTYLRGTGK